MPVPRLLFPIPGDLQALWQDEETLPFFEGGNLVIHCDRGSYVPEFDVVEPAVRGLTRTVTPYHRIDHARFTVTCQDNRAFIYWILKQLEKDSFKTEVYTPVKCIDYVLPDIIDLEQGYSERQSAQFHVWTEGAFLIKGDYKKFGTGAGFEEWEKQHGDRYFEKISFTYEILRVDPSIPIPVLEPAPTQVV